MYYLPALPEGAFFLTVEGNIGSGKSTFLKKLHQTYHMPITLEPHTMWQNVGGHNLLQEFYENTHRWAYSFQTYAFLTRLKAFEETLKENALKSSCFVTERSVYADKFCFAKACKHLGSMSDLEWNLYCSWHDWLVEKYVKKPAGIIYLQVDPDVSYKRIGIRNRHEELSVPLTYIQLLHQYHEDWLIKKQGVPSYLSSIPVLTLNCNLDFEYSENNWKDLSLQISFFLDCIKNKSNSKEFYPPCSFESNKQLTC